MYILYKIKYKSHYSLQEELDLTPPNKEAMLELSAEKKWQIYCNKKMVMYFFFLVFGHENLIII